MKSRRRLVKDIKRLARVPFGKFGSQFDTLALPTGERGGTLSELDISQPDILQGFYLRQNLRYVLEELHRHVDRHVQHIGNGLAFEAHLERLTVVTFSMTYFARYHHVGQEIHLDGLVAIAATGLTASTFHVEGEPAGLVATYLGFRKIDEELTDVREYAGISCRVAAGRTADGALVDIHHLVYIVDAFNLLVGHRPFERSVEVLRKDGLEGLVDQRALTRP